MKYKSEPKFNGVYSRNDLPKVNDGTYVKTLEKYESIPTQWIPLYADGNNIIYFESFGVEHIPKEI